MTLRSLRKSTVALMLDWRSECSKHSVIEDTCPHPTTYSQFSGRLPGTESFCTAMPKSSPGIDFTDY